MDAYVIKDRSGIWWGCITAAIFLAVVFYFRSSGTGLSVFVSICGLFVTLAVLWDGVQTKTFSKEGICVKRILKTTEVSWDQVEDIRVLWMQLGIGSPRWYISITWPARDDRKTWVQNWLWWMKLNNKPGFLFPYTDQLQKTIVRYYGPLDFDGRDEAGAAIN